MKKVLFSICLVSLFSATFFVSEEIIVNACEEQKIYCDANLCDDFSANEIMVTLKHLES